jgi:hypothetical protein
MKTTSVKHIFLHKNAKKLFFQKNQAFLFIFFAKHEKKSPKNMIKYYA